MRGVFVQPERCIGCQQCEIACAVEHSQSKDLLSAFLETPVPRTRIHVEPGPTPTLSFPNRCRHCDPAPCETVCPAGAISRSAEGLEIVDPDACIGCAMCAVVCPFDAVTFHPLVGGPGPDTAVAVKCDGCVERVRRGDVPACVEVCKAGALLYGEFDELIATGRLSRSAAVGVAADTTPAGPSPTALVAAWRAWGASAAQLAGARDTVAIGSGSGAKAGAAEEGALR